MSTYDSQMPKGWHQIKSILLTEIVMSNNFHHISKCADALFHARLFGEGVAKEILRWDAQEKFDGDSRSDGNG